VTDLIERLRYLRAVLRGPYDKTPLDSLEVETVECVKQAADEIERLRRRELDYARIDAAMIAENEENERLRAALVRIMSMPTEDLSAAPQIAREALSKETRCD